MTRQESFDRYTIIKALILMADKYEQLIVSNPLHTQERRQDLIQSNNVTFNHIIDRLVEKS